MYAHTYALGSGQRMATEKGFSAELRENALVEWFDTFDDAANLRCATLQETSEQRTSTAHRAGH